MSSIKLVGILTDVFPAETKPNFSKKVFWLKEPGTERNPNHWEIELHGRDIDELKGKAIGDRLECEVEVRGRKWENRGQDKIFISLKCIGMRVLEKLETVPGKYIPKGKPGRESDADRAKPQMDLPL